MKAQVSELMLGGQKIFTGTREDSYKIIFFIGMGFSTGLKRYQERQIRLYCRLVLLDHWPNQPVKKFWLNLLLNPWPLVSQARLLFILYGPSCPDGKNERKLPHLTQVSVAWLSPCSIKLRIFCFKLQYKHIIAGTLNWHSLVEMELPRRSLQEVANAIHLLFGDADLEDQSNQSMLTILEELIGIALYQLSTSLSSHEISPMSVRRPALFEHLSPPRLQLFLSSGKWTTWPGSWCSVRAHCATTF